MEITDYKEGDEGKIIELYKVVFKREWSYERWLWRFEKNPAGKHLIKLMWSDGKLVGHYAVSPQKMRIDQKEQLTALSLTTMTHPDYGGRGICGQLSDSLYAYLENDLGVKAIWGFPNNNSHYGFVKNLGWTDVGILHTLSIPADRIRSASTQHLRAVPSFAPSDADVLSDASWHHRVAVFRDLGYLTWRYQDKPAANYRIFEFGEPGHGVMVTKLYPSAVSRDMYDINILEIALVDKGDLKEFIGEVVAAYSEKIDKVTIWQNLWHNDHLMLEKSGFIPSPPQTYLGVRSHEPIDTTVGNIRNWYYSFGDSDVY